MNYGNYFSFASVSEKFSDYVVTLKCSEMEIEIKGLLVDDTIGFQSTTNLEDSIAAKMIKAARGAVDGATAGAGGQALATAKDAFFGKTNTFYDNAKTYLGGTVSTLPLSLFIDMTNKSYSDVMKQLHQLSLPRMGNVGDSAAGKVPIMASGLIKNELENSVKQIKFNYYDSKLLGVTIGSWLAIPGGMWATQVSTPITRIVDFDGKPLKFAEVSLTLQYHRDVDYDTFARWFRK